MGRGRSDQRQVKSQKAKVKSRITVYTLISMLAGLKDEKRQLESTIAAIETAKLKRKAGPEPPISVN
jgi:hypothetical protein